MNYQLPPLLDDDLFEKLVRDILRREYNDPGIECFGRRGQSQYGVDGLSPSGSGIAFQCKLKDTRYSTDEDLRAVLSREIGEEFAKTKGLNLDIKRFIFATTFKNDTHLQLRARELSEGGTIVEYWGWNTINEKIWVHEPELIQDYYPGVPIRSVAGFRQIRIKDIESAALADPNEQRQLAFEYYRINDRDDVVFKIVCNNLDIRNDVVLEEVLAKLDYASGSHTLWLLGTGGCGKTTILHRLAVELARTSRPVFMLNLESQLGEDDLGHIQNLLKYSLGAGKPFLCVDNPAADEDALTRLLRRLPELGLDIDVVLSERSHRYQAMKNSGALTFIHGEEESAIVVVRNPRRQRQMVYDRLFELLGIDDSVSRNLRDIALDENVVYVNATYTMLLDLKKKRHIDFAFDWDDYRKSTDDLPAFRDSYRYIALFYLLGVKTPFELIAKISGADRAQKVMFLSMFSGLHHAPVVVTEWRDKSDERQIFVRTKHEIISEIFFREHPELNLTELLIGVSENVDFDNPVETQALVNVFGAKKNYFAPDESIDALNLSRVIEFLLSGKMVERVKQSRKLFETLHLAKCWHLLSQGNESEAAETLRTVLRLSPNNLHSRTELAKIYQQQNKFTAAEAVLKEILKISPNDLNSRTELAKIYQHQNKCEDAEDILKEVLEISPNDLNSRTELAKIYQRQEKFDKAESILGELLDLDRNNLMARTELAKIYQRQGKLDDAEIILKKILDISPNDLISRTELAKVYQWQGKLAEAEALLREVLVIEPRQIHPRTELAKIYQRQGKLAEAEALLREALVIEPRQLHPRTELAKIYQRQGKLAEAETLLREALVIEPRQLHPRTELAKIYQRQGKLVEAEVLLRESLAIDSKQLHPRLELSRIYQRQDKLIEAEKLAEEVLSMEPKDNHAISELLAIWKKQKKAQLCVSRFNDFINQPGFVFDRFSQAPVFRFFLCCRDFGLKKEADAIFERFGDLLDGRNYRFYRENFR